MRGLTRLVWYKPDLFCCNCRAGKSRYPRRVAPYEYVLLYDIVVCCGGLSGVYVSVCDRMSFVLCMYVFKEMPLWRRNFLCTYFSVEVPLLVEGGVRMRCSP